MKNNGVFPPDWKEIIQGKKVIFYNTGVSSLLQGKTQCIEKMRWVFDFFSQHPEVVLWWRPHPLEISTVKSMAPELEQLYLQVRQQYKNEKVGILDESADLHRAIAVSDAYYGIWSSVLHLYRFTSKPILFQNLAIQGAEEGWDIVDFILEGKRVWFITSDLHMLLSSDIENGEMLDAVTLPDELIYQSFSNYNMLKYDGKLFLVPGTGKNILIYDIESKSISKINLGRTTEMIKFGAVHLWKDYLYLFPFAGNEIWKIDLKGKKVTKKINFAFAEKIDKVLCENEKGVYFTNNKLLERKFDNVFFLNFENDRVEAYVVCKEKNIYKGIIQYDESNFILISSLKREIVLWNKDTGKVQKLVDFPDDYIFENSNDTQLFFGGKVQNDIYIFSNIKNNILTLNVNNRKISAIAEFGKQEIKLMKRQGEYMYIYSRTECCFFVINTLNRQIKKKELKTFLNQKNKFSHINFWERAIAKEKNNIEAENATYFSLSNFIFSVGHFEYLTSKRNDYKEVGGEIYNIINKV